ncbi:MAG: thermonuclease family protein [Oscillatoriaceae bacterium SKYG93]|nr:thermonuclease family protein [Oscillatoriaceae bacterium SKYG93]MDW8453062.1 thermonuclease family protein [Oscillatoriaceae cyanobacterium SKYGB_i_bin93]
MLGRFWRAIALIYQFKKTLFLWLCSFALLFSCAAPIKPQGMTVQVKRVISGQSLQIFNSGGDDIPSLVRLIGIDAPDLKQQPWGINAQQRLQQLIDGHPLLLEFDVQQKYCYLQRCFLLAYVWRDDILLNEQLLKEGCVLFSPRSPNTKYNQRFAYAQEWARLMGKGIWNPENPMRQTPAEFRSQYP